ncbi:erythromycin esterase family protein [Actinomadura barringtoniae]|uniref:Erythromycin esterase family protein n=1 Tax=Actinomadura barringtoniae TaxID=1427535 RepID=A0A939TAX2_9ACTN|nr:erythromycin esterase family protein [Actinomadura barringtoniae]MBO2449530.1 erythromycin esterase family protein [Actinomadura barringtoniae]
MRPHRIVAFTLPVAAAASLTGTATATAATAAGASAEPRPVASWITRNATPLSTIDPRAPLTDLAPLRRTIGDATIVGLGESTHGASEEAKLKHRVLRLLVERMGFRSIAWEEDWTLGLQLNDYILTGKRDPAALLKKGDWQSQEVLDVLHWLRSFNKAHPHDPVRFFGVEYYATQRSAYDAVTAYTAKNAPDRLAEVKRQVEAILPWTADIGAYVQWLWKDASDADKQRFATHARALYSLVERLPHRRGYEVTLHAARQILSFYEHYDLKDNNAYRDEHTSQNLRWWRSFSHDKVVYWAAAPHSANAPHVRLSAAPGPDITFAGVGSFMRRWYGERYRSIGFTFDHGSIAGDPGGPALPAPPPPEGWAEHPLGRVPYAQYAIDLRKPAPPAVTTWLTSPATTRGLIWVPSSTWTGGSLRQYYDAIVHRQTITPQHPL